jgi:hypothetical protein
VSWDGLNCNQRFHGRRENGRSTAGAATYIREAKPGFPQPGDDWSI